MIIADPNGPTPFPPTQVSEGGHDEEAFPSKKNDALFAGHLVNYGNSGSSSGGCSGGMGGRGGYGSSCGMGGHFGGGAPMTNMGGSRGGGGSAGGGAVGGGRGASSATSSAPAPSAPATPSVAATVAISAVTGGVTGALGAAAQAAVSAAISNTSISSHSTSSSNGSSASVTTVTMGNASITSASAHNTTTGTSSEGLAVKAGGVEGKGVTTTSATTTAVATTASFAGKTVSQVTVTTGAPTMHPDGPVKTNITPAPVSLGDAPATKTAVALSTYNDYYTRAETSLSAYTSNPAPAQYNEAHSLITAVDQHRQVAIAAGVPGDSLRFQSTLEAVLNSTKAEADERRDVAEDLLASMAYMQAEVEKLNAQQLALATERLRALKAMEAAGEIPFVDALGAYTDCLAEYYDNRPEARTEALQAIDQDSALWDGVKEGLSFAIDFVPVLGTMQSLGELITGTNLITGYEVSRVVAVAGLLGGLIPLPGGGKGIKTAVKRSGSVRRAIKHEFQRYLNVRALRRFNLDRLGIPKNYVRGAARKDPHGIRFHHPHHRDEVIRIMPGKPHSGLPHQQKPYVVHTRGRDAIDKYGNVVNKISPEAHIPLNEYIFRPRP